MSGVTNMRALRISNPQTPCAAITIDAGICTGCNRCVEVCRCDVLVPSTKKGQPPEVLYPDECWFCGCCAGDCPTAGAITMNHPLSQRAAWKRKETGEFFRIGMSDPPPPCTRPPVGGWR